MTGMLREDRAKQVMDAKRQIVEGSLTIWNARLDMLMQSGNSNAIHNLLKSPVEEADNCGCGNNCGCSSEAFERENMTAPGTPGAPV
jgi:hypothetical protein